jgi:hypothetical protein
MNKQEYNELNLIISYFALLVSNGEWKAMENILGWEHTIFKPGCVIQHRYESKLLSWKRFK